MNIWNKGAGAQVDIALSQDSRHCSLLSRLLHITAIAVHHFYSSMYITIICPIIFNCLCALLYITNEYASGTKVREW